MFSRDVEVTGVHHFPVFVPLALELQTLSEAWWEVDHPPGNVPLHVNTLPGLTGHCDHRRAGLDNLEVVDSF